MADKVTARVVDFTNVKDSAGFNKKRLPSGDYLGRIIKVVDAESKSDQTPQYLFTVQIVKHSQSKFPYYCKLQENQLWKLRNLLVAAGLPVPKRRTKIDPTKAVGKLVGVTLEDDEYEGREQSTIEAVFPSSELDDSAAAAALDDSTEDNDDADVDEDEAEDDGLGDMAADAEEDDEEEAEEEAEAEEGDEFDGMDRTALKTYIKGKDASAVFRKSDTDDDLRAKARELAGGGDDEDELDELEIEDL